MKNMNRISLDTAVIVTRWSRSTWFRRIAAGEVTRLSDDSRRRTMLALADVIPKIPTTLGEQDQALLVQADGGDAAAQNDMGMFFAAAGMHDVAAHWLALAANNEYPDAMQLLGCCYLRGEGVAKDENLGIMWIAKAAALGHVIARAQIAALHPKSNNS